MQHTEGRRDTRAGCYKRKLQTKTGEVTLIERCRRKESPVTHLDVSGWGIGTESIKYNRAPVGARMGPGTVSKRSMSESRNSVTGPLRRITLMSTWMGLC